MNRSISALAAVIVMLSGTAGMALPTLYPTDTTLLSKITNTTNSNLIMDDTDPRRIYVMPPNSAVAMSAGLHTLNANIGFCKELAETQSYSRQYQQVIADLDLKVADSAKEVKGIREELFKARKDAADYAAQKNLTALIELDNRITALEGRLSDLYKADETCRESCDGVATEIRDVNAEKTKLMKDRREMAAAHAGDVRQYDKYQAKIANLSQNLADAAEGYSVITSKLMKSKAQLREMFASFGKLEGARAAFVYLSNWDGNIAALREQNPGFSFEKIQTANARLHSSLIGLNPTLASGAVLAYETPGKVSTDGVLELPAYPENFSANVVLSLLGVCPIRYPEYFDDKQMPTEKDMKYGLTIAYEFPSAFKLSVTAKYNMYKMYQKVVESGSSGGFFSSRSWTNVSERTDFKDAFRIEWTQQDSANSVKEEERVSIEQEMKADIFKRMAIMAMPSTPDKGAMIAALAPPSHGAVVLSDTLMKSCPGNAYCMGGALIVNVLDAIFGHSSAVANYVQTQDIEVVNSWSRTKVSLKPWVTSYIP